MNDFPPKTPSVPDEERPSLWPAVIQDADTRQVLMVGYMNEESWTITQATNRVTFYSRSRKRLWEKGETSGNSLLLTNWAWDCDSDALLIEARSLGPTCHRLTESCFESDTRERSAGLLETLRQSIRRSVQRGTAGESRAALAKGPQYWIRKLQEEACEVGLALTFDKRDRVREELADLFYRASVLMEGAQIELSEVENVLLARRRSGLSPALEGVTLEGVERTDKT